MQVLNSVLKIYETVLFSKPYSAVGFLWKHRLFVSVSGSNRSRCSWDVTCPSMDLPLSALHTGSEAQRSGRHLPDRRAEISVCLMVEMGSVLLFAGCWKERFAGFCLLAGAERERGLCLTSPGDTTLNKAVHAGILRKTSARPLLRASGAGETHVHKSLCFRLNVSAKLSVW